MLSLIRIPYATYESIITKGMEDGELKPDDPQDVMHIIYGLFSGLTTLYYEKDLTDIRRIYHKGIGQSAGGYFNNNINYEKLM